MTAAATATKAQAPLSNKAREMMEAINTDAAKHHVWIRTQANAPAQRPWFSDTSGEGLTNFGAEWYALAASGRAVEPSQPSSGGGYGSGGGW